jgi:hypothetical protein
LIAEMLGGQLQEGTAKRVTEAASNSTTSGKCVVRRRKPMRLPICSRPEMVETPIASALTFMYAIYGNKVVFRDHD